MNNKKIFAFLFISIFLFSGCNVTTKKEISTPNQETPNIINETTTTIINTETNSNDTLGNTSENISNIKNTQDEDFLNREKQAEKIIRNLETVKNWLKQFSNSNGTSPITGGKAIIDVERNEYDVITFHLYENTKERNITFDWYDVDMETSIVTNMMLEEVK
ncbi:MAG: hypothetical protein WC070_04615 [Candidatus Magasanikbacteria bacterium]